MNDRYMKNAAAEIHKLRKEKQQIKSSAMLGAGLKVTQGGKKTDKLKDVLVEIEKVRRICRLTICYAKDFNEFFASTLKPTFTNHHYNFVFFSIFPAPARKT